MNRKVYRITIIVEELKAATRQVDAIKGFITRNWKTLMSSALTLLAILFGRGGS
jgi:hypothetical protein